MTNARPKFGYTNKTLIYNVWDNDFDIVRKGNFATIFKQQLDDEGITDPKMCIFDCTNEGVGTTDIELMFDSIKTKFPQLKLKVLFNVPVTKKTNYEYRCFLEHMVAHCGFVRHVNSLDVNWELLQIDKHFISLQRRASNSRLKFTKKLLDTFGSSQYIISCATQPNKWINELPNLKEAIHPYKIPILVDGMIDSDNKQHYHRDESFFKCMVNVITETSSQTDDDSWREIFLTEKTFKSFAYRQLPIWFAVPGTVQVVRDLGFDVFDDIINHSYDSIIDTSKRSNAVVDALSIFCKNNDTNKLNILRFELWDRISNNMKLLTKMAFNHRLKKHSLILELIE